ncbi:ARM repeat-containing protein [Fistulina hepatica ATCC 64428]|uniref:ARM repeat-containing protein n=1 Tax=Fistulina hepatica ATCC 64428 TaxID=1128425 RepID=A0A0D7AII7_9AGAR|nr:ARM repeat-containing protein [Fistulina hepatica ATCC 64428]
MDFLPILPPDDVQRVTQLILHMTTRASSDEVKAMEREILVMQQPVEAWGLVIPLLNHESPAVQFFGAHTAQVKITRDWEQIPPDAMVPIRDLMIQLTAHALATAKPKMTTRKLFVALSSLALRLVPWQSGSSTRWPDWILSCVTAFSSRGAPAVEIHEFFAIIAEDISTADMIQRSRMQVRQSMHDASDMVVQSITRSLASPHADEIAAATGTLQAWLQFLRADQLTPLIAPLIALLDPFEADRQTVREDSTAFVAASDALQEILSRSPLADGSGTKSLTEPLLFWLEEVGSRVVDLTVQGDDRVSEASHSLCKLLCSLGDHSTSYFAINMAENNKVVEFSPTVSRTKAHLTQLFLKILLAYTGLPGYYGIDEEDSEMTLGFWYLFQEALWATDYGDGDGFEGEDEDTMAADSSTPKGDSEQVKMSRVVYRELIQVLRRKVMFPTQCTWAKDQVERFSTYRRDIGDTLINAYYILRDEMLECYINDAAQQLAAGLPQWEIVEADLHCLAAIEESVPMDQSPSLARVFGDEILGRVAAVATSSGTERLRRTMVVLIGAYSNWFANRLASTSTPLLLASLDFVVTALIDPTSSTSTLSLQAANALRSLCDANRASLAPHIASFGQLHASSDKIPDTEKPKVLQSIASVIQAVPLNEEIVPVEAITDPIVQKLAEALQSSSALPDEARAVIILQLETLSGVAKGLTLTDELGRIDDDETKEQAKIIDMAREDPRMVNLRHRIYEAIRVTMELWSLDAGVCTALIDLCKAITSLPSDTTILTLPAAPLLQLVCFATQRQVTASWLSLAAILIGQMSSRSFFGKREGDAEATELITQLLPVLLQNALGFLGQPNAMRENPDIVQEFFGCMNRVAQDFAGVFYSIPAPAFDALVQCSVTALSLQERYSLVAACNFLNVFINRSSIRGVRKEQQAAFMQQHGRAIMKAIMEGFCGITPLSTTQNLIELLSTCLYRCPEQSKAWLTEVLYAVDFVQSKAGREAKDKFIGAVVGSRSTRGTREAAQQFSLVARGLEGTNFGYTSVSV